MSSSLSPTDCGPPDQHPVLLDPPKFGLRALWCLVTILCGVFALWAAIGPVWSAGLTFLGMLMAGHVLGNMLGTQLGSRGHRMPGDDTGRPAPPRAGRPDAATGPWRLAPSHLRQRRPVGRIVLPLSVASAAVGGVVGGALLVGTRAARIDVAAAVLGTLSSAVLGAWFGFMVICFWNVTCRAWQEAQQGHGDA